MSSPATWPTAPQRRVLSAAEVKPDFPSEAMYEAGALMLRCEAAALKAVGIVEAGTEGAFLDTGEPTLLYERHLFHRLTKGRHDGRRAPGLPDAVSHLSSPKPGGYGPVRIQHQKLQAAVKLDRIAALSSCSWGLFQILGLNHARCGYLDVPGEKGSGLQRFVTAMYRSADDHLRALVAFLRADQRLVDAIRSRNWPMFASIYNGRNYRINKYDLRLAESYARLVRA